jgi:excisionase family DNA binding protein
MKLEEFLTTTEVAEWLKCSEWHVRQEVARGHLRALHLGRHLRFVPDDIRAWLGQVSA